MPPVRQCQIILHIMSIHGPQGIEQQSAAPAHASFVQLETIISQPFLVFVYFSQSHKHSIWKHGLPS